MSATATPLLDLVRDMERRAISPFRYDRAYSARLADLACDLRQAACADDARAVARYIRQTRLERLWCVESWIAATSYRHPHPRIERWLHEQLVEIGWRSPCQ